MAVDVVCPACNGIAHRVIFMAAPMKVCSDEQCGTLFGFWSFMAELFPVVSTDHHGEPAWAFMVYEGSGYLTALWHWIRGDYRE